MSRAPLQGLAPATPHCRIQRLRSAIERALLAIFERQERRERLLFEAPESVLQRALADDDAGCRP
jgi:hypothetical protein